ncbi:MAG: cyclic nucleotide-binding domain-containing protein [Candidatus Cloacimonadota bacterium]|nr:cyclic nucleotide-binding domain-containing protein [Candidatus Cloacimonadota bacterium]
MDINFLKEVKLFEKLTEDELRIISEKMKTCEFKKDDFIIQEGTTGDELFILHEGTVQIKKKMTMLDEEESKDKTFIELSATDRPFFGEIGILGEQKRTANVIASTHCTLYKLKHKDFMETAKHNPEIGFKLIFAIALKLSRLVEKTNSDVLKLTTALIYALR